MIKPTLAVLSCVCVAAVLAADSTPLSAHEGGLVRTKGKGYVAVIDCRGAAAGNECAEGIQKVIDTFQPEIRVVRGKAFSLANAVTQLGESGGNAAVFIVDDPSLPITLTAYEEKWTLLNTAKVATDRPTAEKLKKRMSILFMRQCTRILGSDASKTPETCHYHAFSLSDLDSINTYDVGLGTSICVGDSMERLGIEAIELVTYKDACQMGIAPPPTNDIQRVIWEKVHSPPKTPLKIKFDPATKKGKVTK